MDRKNIEILELDKIKEELKGYAATIPAQEQILGLTPVVDLDYVRKCLKEVTAARELMAEFGMPGFGGIRDLRQVLDKLEKGIVLSLQELVDISDSLRGFRSLKRYFREIIDNTEETLLEKYYGLIIQEGEKIIILKELERELEACLDEYGGLKDSASPALARIRSEINRTAHRIREKMDNIIKSPQYQEMLQDNLITKRRDRYVVPVKSEYRNIFQGIVHDQSASGLTLFMEPLAVVQMNNKLSELENEEEKEIYRILKMLSDKAGEYLYELRNNLEVATFLDLCFAKADYSRKIGGVEPEINDQGIIYIVKGRHPLLGEKAVPIDIHVGDKFKTLVITGPNTGGKTVALKTVGLFVLMAQCGIHVPAGQETRLAVFKNVFVDIGDEQSIEQNLSTFSSHMHRIRDFLYKADQESLVLIDELGAGTDPGEGAALGIAIMNSLRKKQATTIVTTHYSQLKNYAYDEEGVENASVEFDLNTLEPTYRILMGVPGGSNAITIARKLGIPEEIVEEASKYLSTDEIKVEKMISALSLERDRYSKLKEEYLAKKEKIDSLIKKYEEMVQRLEKERERILEEARKEAEGILETARRETRNILQDLKKSEFQFRSDIDRKGNQLNQHFKEMEEKLFPAELEEEGKRPRQALAVGDEVRLLSTGSRGQVLSIDEDRQEATVQAGIITVKVSLGDLIKAEMPEIEKKEMVKRYRVRKTERVSPSLDLRGKRYEDAQRILDKYLDDVFLAGLKQVEIIHGKGTGALRIAVQEILEAHAHVKSHRLGRQEEGGLGVTIVDIY